MGDTLENTLPVGDRLFFYDQGNPIDAQYILSATDLYRVGTGQVSYETIESVFLTTGS